MFHESECGLRRPIFFRTRCGRLPTMSESGCGPPDPDFLRFQENGRITMLYSLEDQSWFPPWRTLWILALLSLVSINANAAQEFKPKFNVVALAEHGRIHQPFVDLRRFGCRTWRRTENFPSITYRTPTKSMTPSSRTTSYLFSSTFHPTPGHPRPWPRL